MQTKPYAIVSDQHFHNWQKFNAVNEKGVNTRLQFQLGELRRCANELRDAGGNLIVNAGDTFHVRGSLAPTVLNPVLDLHRELIAEGFEIIIDAGNHDLEGKDAERLSSAATALENVGCKVVSSWEHGLHIHDYIVVVPWFGSVRQLKEKLELIDPTDRAGVDLILHAPVDGVLIGIPDHGLTGEYLANLGFRRVFTGHYHNHKEVVPGKVWSIGATTHQTWSDVGTKAGFLIVREDGVTWRKSHAPEFVQINGGEDELELAAMVQGNYIRAFIDSGAKSKEVAALRELFTSHGAREVVLIPQGSAKTTRATGAVTVTKGETLEASVAGYVKAQKFENEAAVNDLCAQILAEARAGALSE
jgi:DNA repair exonuclease SbcCD nuclease subunit